ncbi:MAG: PatB family C-S lyase [Cytophagales bacterium]|nr:PatB family C-S lyase [Cytophagales bacterium]
MKAKNHSFTEDFDSEWSRAGTGAIKYEMRKKLFGSGEVIPLWVADMDLPMADEIKEALAQRLEHPFFGYTLWTDSCKDALVRWMYKRYRWSISPKWLGLSMGVMPSISFLLEEFTAEQDPVIILSPVYNPFREVVEDGNRRLVESAMKLTGGKYVVDFEDFEKKIIRFGVKVFLLCNPHNPSGRMWTAEELQKLASVCERHGVLVVSDEIHADLALQGKTHVPFAKTGEWAKNHSVTCVAPSKTFNLAGFNTSVTIIPNSKLRVRFARRMQKLHWSYNTLALTAMEAAYRDGNRWLERLKKYVWENYLFLRNFVEKELPEVKLVEPEAGYLLWLDFRDWKMTVNELNDFLVHEARLGLSDGASFGKEGEGFQRLNMACSRSVLEQAMRQLKEAAEKLKKE